MQKKTLRINIKNKNKCDDPPLLLLKIINIFLRVQFISCLVKHERK